MLWLLTTFPAWFFHLILFSGIIILIVAAVMHRLPMMERISLELKIVSLVLIISGLLFEGALSLKKDYELQAADLQHKLDVATAKGETIVTKVVDNIVYRDKIITKQGAAVVQYIDRETIKIDSSCTLTPEAVQAHNNAAADPMGPPAPTVKPTVTTAPAPVEPASAPGVSK